MSLTSALLCVAVMVSSVLFQTTKAVPTPHDRDRAILAWNLGTDLCFRITDNSYEEEQDAANWACGESFKALDNLNSNICNGWRKPACRQMTGYAHQQCTCKILTHSPYAGGSDVTKSFRDCTYDFWTDELQYGRLEPSVRFQTASRRIEDNVQAGREYREALRAGGWFVDPRGESNSKRNAGASRKSSAKKRKKPESSSSSSSMTYFCHFCGNPYASAMSFNQHLASHTTDIATCTVCKKRLSTKSNLTAHMKWRHPKEYLATASDEAGSSKKIKPLKTFECDVCKRIYKSAQLLRDHSMSHTRILICKVCLKSYVSIATFETHTVSHPEYETVNLIISDEEVVRMYNEANPHQCPDCGVRYSSEKGFRAHLKSHNTKSTYCKDCDKTYSTPSSYYLHMRNKHGGAARGAN